MRLERGDVVLRRGKFFLVWQEIGKGVQLFPVTPAREGAECGDLTIGNWDEFEQYGGEFPIVRLTDARIVPSHDLVKFHALTFSPPAIAAVLGALRALCSERGPTLSWPPLGGPDPDGRAPILAS